MITIVTPYILETLFPILGVRSEAQEPVLLKDYVFRQDLKGHFWLQREPGAETEALQVTLTAESGWRLEAFQSVLSFESDAVKLNDGKLQILTEDEIEKLIGEKAKQGQTFDPVYAFFRRQTVEEERLLYDAEAMGDLLMRDRQLNRSDLYLMVPGKVKKEAWAGDPWAAFEDKGNDVFRFFRDHIDYNVRMEYEGDFLNELDRRCLGSAVIEVPQDYVEGGSFFQPATICVVTHSTGLCVLEILVNNCFIGGNKLLNYYRGNELRYHYGGKVYSLAELLDLFAIRSFGDNRSLVFAYGDIEKQAIVNALANEEYPMGKIGGLFRKRVEECNIALYDTAEVYVSPVTLIECVRNWDPVAIQLRNRLNYQVIEIFYVELLLFQDAAIDKVHKDLLAQQELQYDSSISKINMDRVEEINFDMARAIRFSDYTQFRFPTTRESAKTVSALFGMEQVFEKYEQNKELLDAMIKTNQRRISKRENKIKNGFLLLLSFVSTAKSVSGIIEALTNDNMTELLVYLASIAIVAVVLSLNWLNDRRKDRQRKEKREGMK
ncbi:MAG: hypothetical protein E7223_00240 [Clostridiales bacterium]|nr:hypothetical protein [Clostridiales bacterium]